MRVSRPRISASASIISSIRTPGSATVALTARRTAASVVPSLARTCAAGPLPSSGPVGWTLQAAGALRHAPPSKKMMGSRSPRSLLSAVGRVAAIAEAQACYAASADARRAELFPASSAVSLIAILDSGRAGAYSRARWPPVDFPAVGADHLAWQRELASQRQYRPADPDFCL